MNYPHFFAAIEQLGRNSHQRAAKLGMTPRALQKWKRGRIPTLLHILVNNPLLLDALLQDAQNQPEKPSLSS